MMMITPSLSTEVPVHNNSGSNRLKGLLQDIEEHANSHSLLPPSYWL